MIPSQGSGASAQLPGDKKSRPTSSNRTGHEQTTSSDRSSVGQRARPPSLSHGLNRHPGDTAYNREVPSLGLDTSSLLPLSQHRQRCTDARMPRAWSLDQCCCNHHSHAPARCPYTLAWPTHPRLAHTPPAIRRCPHAPRWSSLDHCSGYGVVTRPLLLLLHAAGAAGCGTYPRGSPHRVQQLPDRETPLTPPHRWTLS